MAKLTPEQRELRLRLCAHLRRIYAEHRFEQRQQMAEKLPMDAGHFSALYNFKSEIGLDMAVQIHRAFGESLNALCDTDPPAAFYPPGYHPGYFARAGGAAAAAESQAPYSASPVSAQPEKRTRRRAGGKKR